MVGEGKPPQLGRGLSALLGDEEEPAGDARGNPAYRTVPIESVCPGRFQPRRMMNDPAIEELADSIRQKGILQPILVRADPNQADSFEIIAGERRWRAAQRAQLAEVPVHVRDLADSEVLEIALVENLQRQDLSPLEEAEGYLRLMEEFQHTQQALARAVGKSRSHVANTLRLLSLPEEVRAMVDLGDLSAGHARAILTAEAPLALAQTVVRRSLNVRQTEKLAQSTTTRPRNRPSAPGKDADTMALERDLTTLLGLRVELKFNSGGGVLSLHYQSLEQLDDILHRLSHGTQGAPATPSMIEPPTDVSPIHSPPNEESDVTPQPNHRHPQVLPDVDWREAEMPANIEEEAAEPSPETEPPYPTDFFGDEKDDPERRSDT